MFPPLPKIVQIISAFDGHGYINKRTGDAFRIWSSSSQSMDPPQTACNILSHSDDYIFTPNITPYIFYSFADLHGLNSLLGIDDEILSRMRKFMYIKSDSDKSLFGEYTSCIYDHIEDTQLFIDFQNYRRIKKIQLIIEWFDINCIPFPKDQLSILKIHSDF